jgi:oxygen-dependent protoporphyrinogen oxidase
VLNLTDEEIVATVRAELKEIVKLDARPMFERVYRWRGAMAQYESGHLARVARIDKRVKEIPGLELAGNAYRGIGVPDCIREGTSAANGVVQALTAAANSPSLT